MPPMSALKPEDPITSIRLSVKTADVFAAGTDNTIHCFMIPIPGSTQANTFELQGSFERGDTDTTEVPAWYFAGRVVNDIRLLRFHKGPDGIYGGWALAGVAVWVNGQQFYSTPAEFGHVWLEDSYEGRTWDAPNFLTLDFVKPTLPFDKSIPAEPGHAFHTAIVASGGKPPLHWQIDAAAGAPTPAPAIAAEADTRRATIAGTGWPDKSVWLGTITATDAAGLSASTALSIQSLATLPPPTITGVTPDFGWPDGGPASRGATLVTITGTNFDTRGGHKLAVSFPAKTSGRVVAVVADDGDLTRVTVAVPDGATSGPIQLETEAGVATSPPFTVHDWGYRFTDGYAFRNRTAKGDSSDGFPDVFGWDRYVEAYGSSQMYVGSMFGSSVPDPYAGLFYLVTRGNLTYGCCHGFALTALRFRQRIDAQNHRELGGAYPLAGTLSDLANGQGSPSETLSHAIQVGQLAMLSDEAFYFFAARIALTPMASGAPFTMDARPMLSDVAAELQNGWADPRMISFAKANNPIESHVVTAHAVTGNLLHTYNPNDPAQPDGATDDSGSRFTINTANGQWTYTLDGATWSGRFCFTIPFSVYGQQYHWSLLSLGAIGTVAGAYGLSFLGSLVNASILYFGSATPGPGVTIEPLAGMTPMSALTGTPAHAVTAKVARVRLSSAAGPGAAAFMLSGGTALSVEEVHGSAIVELDLQAGTARVTEENLASDLRPLIRLVRRDPDAAWSRTYAARPAAGSPKGSFGFAFAATEPKIIASGDVDLHTRRRDALAHDDHAELVAVPHALAVDATLSLPDDGAPRLIGAAGTLLDMSSVKRFQSSLPTHLVDGAPIAARIAADTRTTPAAPPAPVLSAAPPSHATPSVSGFLRPDLSAATLLRGLGPVVARPVLAGRTGPVVLDPGLLRTLLEAPATFTVPAAATAVVRARTCPDPTMTGGKRILSLPRGNRAEMLVEERDGYRAFPRLVTVGSQSGVAPGLPAHVVLAEVPGRVANTDGGPATASAPLVLVLNGTTAIGVEIVLQPPVRRCGPGDSAPVSGLSFALEPSLAAAGATATLASDGRGGGLLTVTWPASSPRAGRIALGKLNATLPPAAASIWTLSGYASVTTPDGVADAGVTPIEFHRSATQAPSPAGPPGMARPRAPRITAPATLKQGEWGSVAVADLPPGLAAVGWWASTRGGDVDVVHDHAPATTARIRGLYAGAVRLRALVGDQIFSATVQIVPVPGFSPLPSEPPVPVPNPLPPLARDPATLTLGERFRDPIWNPGLWQGLGARIDLGRGVTVRPAARRLG